MSVWILLVVVAQFLNALVALVDKYIVTARVVRRPATYAFYVSVLSALSIFVFFFSWIQIPLMNIDIPSFQNIEGPNSLVVFISIVAGFVFLGALVSLFTALQRADTSDVVPVVGAFSAITTLVLSYYFLKTSFTHNFLWGFIFLVLGTLFISLFRFLDLRTLFISIISGVFFAMHFVSLKFLFEMTSFDNAFFWSRLGIVVPAIAMFFLLPMRLRSKKKHKIEAPRPRAVGIILLNKFLAGVASLLILKSIHLGDVSTVQALGGLQFVFLLTFALMTGKSLPEACGEKCSTYDVWQKIISVGIISVGFFILFL